jgi:tetratricopeptide (TPR) repeat protein
MEEPALIDSAQKCFERSLALDPEHEESLRRVAFLRMHRGEYEEARALLLPYARREGGKEVPLLLTAIDYHLLDFDEAQEMLDAALRRLSARERESWLGLRPLLHPDSVGAYKILSEAERDSSRGIVVVARPNADLVGERTLIEHVARAVESYYFGVPWFRCQAAKPTA